MTGSNHTEQQNKLTTKDYTKTALRAYFLQNGFNYSNYQGLGYALAMFPAFKKLYGNDPDRLAQELKDNCEFYNTNPQFLPFITSIHLAMAESGMKYKDIRGIKMALMGPLAGIGDSLSQFCLAPLFSTIFASMAMEGMGFAPIGFLVSLNLILVSIKLIMGNYGRKLGTSMIDKLSEKMGVISDAAGMIGVTVIAGLAATFVKIKVALTFAAGEVQEGVTQSVMDIQGMLDKIAPALLPILYTMLMYYLIKKKKVTTYWLVLLTVVLGVVLSYFGILA